MPKGKAFVLVGHRNWGKSKTLEALTNGSNHVQYVTIKAEVFFIRRMSNDDVPTTKPDKFTKFVESLDPQKRPLVIITLCPNFADSLPNTEAALRELVKKYQLFFFALKYQWHKSGRGNEILDCEIEQLKKFGEVEVYPVKSADDEAKEARANEFRKFIESWLSQTQD